MSSPNENYFQFENLLVKLASSGVDFAVAGGVAISLNGFESGAIRIAYLSPADLIFLKNGSWREAKQK
jgi:hypothetical protein